MSVMIGRDEPTFVIVGASLAGAKAAQVLRDEGFTGRVMLIGAETERPYERPPLSKGYLQGRDPREGAYVHEARWYTEHNVELVLGVPVTALDVATHTVVVNGLEPVRYDKLLLATGSRVRRLDLPGSELLGIHYLRTLADADTLRTRLREGTRVVVVGAGWIGLETAATARTLGAQVTVVEREELPLLAVLGAEVADVYAQVHRSHGVEFHFGTQVREFGGVGGRLTHVLLADGTELAAEVAIVGVGILPATELAEAAGLAVDNGVVTDETLRTSDLDVYAAGDVASSWQPLLGRHLRVEHWANALHGGEHAAKAMLGQEVSHDLVPYFFSDQYDVGMEYAGYAGPDGYDQVVFRGRPSVVDGAAPEFVAFWVKAGRVLAGMNVNVWDVQDQIQALVRAGYAGQPVDLEALADPDTPLTDLVAPAHPQ